MDVSSPFRRALYHNFVQDTTGQHPKQGRLEVVEALVHQGEEVRLIELADRVIPDAFDGEITQHIETELREQGVSLHLGERVEALLGDWAGDRRTNQPGRV